MKDDDDAVDRPDESSAGAGDSSPGAPSAASEEGDEPPWMIHDGFFKDVFTIPEHAAQALRAVTPESLVGHIDWGGLQLENTSFSLEGYHQTHCDILYRTRWTTGEELYVQLLSEHQSTVDRWMILRGLGMIHAAWKRHCEHDPGTRRLPAVLMYVLYHGPTRWTAPTSLEQVIAVPEEIRDQVLEFVPLFRFVLDDLHVVSDELLAGRDMGPYPLLSMAMLKHARKKDFPEKLVCHAPAIRALLDLPGGYTLLEDLFNYGWGVHPEMDPWYLITTLKHIIGPEAEIKMLTYAQRLRKHGFDEGVETGVEKGQRAMMLRLLEQSFGELSDEVQARIAQATAETLDRWALRIRDARSLEDIFQDG